MMRRHNHLNRASAPVLLLALGAALAGEARGQTGGEAVTAPKRFVTQGLAKTVTDNLFKCEVKVTNHRVSAVGTITAADGTTLTVPAETRFQTEQKLPDLFNECNKATPTTLGEVDIDKVPVVEIDADGEVVTGTIVADNYFEVYVNGKLVGVDAVPFTPFNSAIVRFKAKRPYTYALKLVDWEEKLGLGMEKMPDNDWHPGDGGVIARFSDGTVTDSSWKAQSFYIAPLASPDDVIEKGNVHDTTKLGRTHPAEDQAGLPGEMLRGALPDAGHLVGGRIRRPRLAARLRIHRRGYRRDDADGLYALPGCVRRRALDLDGQPRP